MLASVGATVAATHVDTVEPRTTKKYVPGAVSWSTAVAWVALRSIIPQQSREPRARAVITRAEPPLKAGTQRLMTLGPVDEFAAAEPERYVMPVPIELMVDVDPLV